MNPSRPSTSGSKDWNAKRKASRRGSRRCRTPLTKQWVRSDPFYFPFFTKIRIAYVTFAITTHLNFMMTLKRQGREQTWMH